jgi:hypothetical protein
MLTLDESLSLQTEQQSSVKEVKYLVKLKYISLYKYTNHLFSVRNHWIFHIPVKVY